MTLRGKIFNDTMLFFRDWVHVQCIYGWRILEIRIISKQRKINSDSYTEYNQRINKIIYRQR